MWVWNSRGGSTGVCSHGLACARACVRACVCVYMDVCTPTLCWGDSEHPRPCTAGRQGDSPLTPGQGLALLARPEISSTCRRERGRIWCSGAGRASPTLRPRSGHIPWERPWPLKGGAGAGE